MKKYSRAGLAVFLGLIFAFAVAEVSIRLSGEFHFSEARSTNPHRGEFRIAALGNSHTYGFGVPKGLAYPEVLNDFLRKESRGFGVTVSNHGLGNGNTHLAGKRLRKVLADERPDLVLMMVGEPNF